MFIRGLMVGEKSWGHKGERGERVQGKVWWPWAPDWPSSCVSMMEIRARGKQSSKSSS